MRRGKPHATATLMFAAMVIAACGDDPAAPQDDAFTASNVAVSNYIEANGRCAPAQTLVILGTGESNRGTVAVSQSHCFNPLAANPLAFYDGEFTNTFADGSRFSGTYQGTTVPTGNPAVFGIQGEWTVTGGTGSYAGATGSGTATGQANVQTGAGSITLAGTIRR
jgi:hypothetical protein